MRLLWRLISLELVTKFSQHFFPFALIHLALNSFGRRAIHNSENSPALFRLRDDDFNRVGCGAIDGTNFLTLANSIEDIDWECILQYDEKGVARSDISNVVRSRLNKLLIISLVAHQARARGFIESNSKSDAGNRSDQYLVKILYRFDKMALSQNDVAIFWDRESHGFQFQGVILSGQDIGHQFTGYVSQAEMPSLELIS